MYLLSEIINKTDRAVGLSPLRCITNTKKQNLLYWQLKIIISIINISFIVKKFKFLYRKTFKSTLNSPESAVRSPVSTGSTAHPAALAASRWSGSCCAGEPQSSDWPTTAPHGDRTGGDPPWGSGRGGTLLARRAHDEV